MINLSLIHLVIIAVAGIIIFFIGQLIGYLQGVRDTKTEFNKRLQRFKHLQSIIDEWQKTNQQTGVKHHEHS